MKRAKRINEALHKNFFRRRLTIDTKRMKILIENEPYELIPVTVSSTLPDDSENIRFLLEVLVERVKARGAVKIDRENTDGEEIRRYTVLLLKKE